MSSEREEMAALDKAFGAPLSAKVNKAEREASDVVTDVDDEIRDRWEKKEARDRWRQRVRSEESMRAIETRARKENGNPHVHLFRTGVCVACGEEFPEFEYVKQFHGEGRVIFQGSEYYVSEDGDSIVRVR